MKLLDRLLHRVKPVSPSPLASVPCPHLALVPRWDSAGDMGKEDKASSYTCDVCGRSFAVEEARALRASEAERVQKLAAIKTPPAN
jgi:hypothetical protein